MTDLLQYAGSYRHCVSSLFTVTAQALISNQPPLLMKGIASC